MAGPYGSGPQAAIHSGTPDAALGEYALRQILRLPHHHRMAAEAEPHECREDVSRQALTSSLVDPCTLFQHLFRPRSDSWIRTIREELSEEDQLPVFARVLAIGTEVAS